MSTGNRAQTRQQKNNHEFTEETSVFYKSEPENNRGWYFTDTNGLLFGPIRDEHSARHMLAQLSAWFNNGKVDTDE